MPSSTVIDRTSIRVSRLVLGTGSLHRSFLKSARLRLLHTAADMGITHFDTAPYYGDGLAEETLGAMDAGIRARTTLTTKVGLYPRLGPVRSSLRLWARRLIGRAVSRDASPMADFSLATSRASLDDSLRRLRRDHVDFLLLHEPLLGSVPHEPLVAWLAEECRSGRIGAFGIAGEQARLRPFLELQSPLSQVVQTRDSLKGYEASFLESFNRQMQFTYGYFSARGGVSFADALARNGTGAVIFSTQSTARLREASTCLR